MPSKAQRVRARIAQINKLTEQLTEADISWYELSQRDDAQAVYWDAYEKAKAGATSVGTWGPDTKVCDAAGRRAMRAWAKKQGYNITG